MGCVWSVGLLCAVRKSVETWREEVKWYVEHCGIRIEVYYSVMHMIG